MRLTSCSFLLAAAAPCALGAFVQAELEQAPFQLANDYGKREWDTEPNVDATGHLLFNSVSSLLQRWPNTVVRPGECACAKEGSFAMLSYQIDPPVGSRGTANADRTAQVIQSLLASSPPAPCSIMGGHPRRFQQSRTGWLSTSNMHMALREG